MLLTDEQMEECLLAAEVEAAAPEEEWLLYGRKVEQLVRAELERENERLRSIVAKGRDAYSAYGLLATLPGHEMYSETGAKLRREWLRETDEYLRELRRALLAVGAIDQAREKG